eukprot:CAMPEP_0174832208 /NCGR_PEP_ID=MMETSP1114-20130205/3550_1 /TAXON_ID=312471 /ORGANISM="Neobodo designis, Strain CCAP 1951/1" /LENGTH=348 /DNA_ID=CAMNT_0016066063 /DNA_START=30 /DNA_END=1076 /DNA_ORIENTATION=-
MSAAASPATAGPEDLLVDLHARFVLKLDERKDTFEHWTMQHLRVSGIYWGAGAMHVLSRLEQMPRDEVVSFALSCRNADGGFGGSRGQDSHMLYTLSAVQVLCIFGAEDQIDRDAVARWVASMQRPDGSFTGDEWGEVDTRFVYIALNCLSLLDRLSFIDVGKAVEFILSCENWDGGFGVSPGAESHAGQVFCCVGALCIAGALDRIDQDRLAWWLAERQLPSGGLNGRPEKAADVCYSWWVLSSLAMLRRLHWIDRGALFSYILRCQDPDDGGIADKPGNYADVYHTFFGACGLSMLGYDKAPLNEINPAYAMPPETLRRLGVPAGRGGDVMCRVDPAALAAAESLE